MKSTERSLEKTESIGNGLNEMKKSSTFRSQQSSRRPSFDVRVELEQGAEEETAAAESSTMMSLAAMENERKELMVHENTLSTPSNDVEYTH